MSATEGTTATHRKLTPAEWEQVVVLWEAGTVTLSDLESKFGISKAALHEGLKKRKAIKGSRAKEFATHTEEALKTDAARRGDTIKKFREDYDKYGDAIFRMMLKELSLLQSERDSSAEVKRNMMRNLKYGAEILKIVRDERFHLLDLYNQTDADEDLPDIAVVQYDDDEIEAIKRRFDKDTVPLLDDDDELLIASRAALDGMLDEAD